MYSFFLSKLAVYITRNVTWPLTVHSEMLPVAKSEERATEVWKAHFFLTISNLQSSDVTDITWGNLSDFVQLSPEPQKALHNLFFSYAAVPP